MLSLGLKISQDTQEILKIYENLVNKHKQVEIYHLYETFLHEVMGNEYESSLISKKKEVMKTSLNYNNDDDKNLINYASNCGIVLISLSNHNFDQIVYANVKAGEILNMKQDEIIGSLFSSYIPKPYDLGHENHVKKFLESCKTTEIINPSNLFLQNKKGFLVEIKISAKLTSNKYDPYMIFSFRPKATSRQIAVVSEEGLVYGHSDRFPYFIGSEDQNIQQKYLTDFIPQLIISDMKLFDPVIIVHNNHELGFVHITRTFRTINIHLLLIIHEKRDIER